MIESRYKIEYVLPDEELKTPSPFRVLWYLLLIPLILLAVTAITYDFSFQKIHKDSLTLFEKAKTHVFNLETKTTIVKETTNPILKTPTVAKQRLPLLSSTSIAKDEINTNKVISNELSAQQELQLKTIQEQIERNSKLSTDLNELSSQLVKEKNINKLLNNQLSQQEIDKLELAEKLNQILFDTKNKTQLTTIRINKPSEVNSDENIQAQSLSNTEDVATVNNTKNRNQFGTDQIIKAMETIKPTPPKVAIIKEKNIELITKKMADQKPETAVSLNKVVNAVKVINDSVTIEDPLKPIITQDQVSAVKEVIELSETDKIIAVMSVNNINPELSTEKVSKNIKATEVGVNLDSQKADKKEIKPISIEVENTIKKQVTSKVEVKELVEPKNKLVFEAKDPETNQETNNIELQTKSDNAVESQSNSSVDAIIAAMEESQPTPTSFEKKIDLELEKDIKTQLVEQGELSVDDK